MQRYLEVVCEDEDELPIQPVYGKLELVSSSKPHKMTITPRTDLPLLSLKTIRQSGMFPENSQGFYGTFSPTVEN